MQQRRTFLTSGLAMAGSGIFIPSLFARQASSNGGDPTTKPVVVRANEADTVWAMGIRVTVLVTAEQTDGAYSVFEDVIPPGAGPPPHVHSREDETIYVLSGTLSAWLDGIRHDISTGDFVHMPRGVEHYFKNVSDEPTKLLLSYTPGGFEEWFKLVGKPIVDDSLKPPETVKADLMQAVREAKKFGVRFKPKKS